MTKLFLLTSVLLVFSYCGNADSKGHTTPPTRNNNLDGNLKAEIIAPIATSVKFKSLDGLPISGKLYETGTASPTILLCHQAGYNLHEYDEIAPKLVTQ